MRNRKLDFPGVDNCTSKKLSRDVAEDREAVLQAVQNLRKKEEMSLEEVSFVLGAHAGQLSRQFKGDVSMTLTSYLRLVRALGYRCQVTFTKVPSDTSDADFYSDLKLNSHRVMHQR